jgi:hypothetical protein
MFAVKAPGTGEFHLVLVTGAFRFTQAERQPKFAPQPKTSQTSDALALADKFSVAEKVQRLARTIAAPDRKQVPGNRKTRRKLWKCEHLL